MLSPSIHTDIFKIKPKGEKHMNHAWSKCLPALLLSALIPANLFAQVEKISDSTLADYMNQLPNVQKSATPKMRAYLTKLDKKNETIKQ